MAIGAQKVNKADLLKEMSIMYKNLRKKARKENNNSAALNVCHRSPFPLPSTNSTLQTFSLQKLQVSTVFNFSLQFHCIFCSLQVYAVDHCSQNGL